MELARSKVLWVTGEGKGEGEKERKERRVCATRVIIFLPLRTRANLPNRIGKRRRNSGHFLPPRFFPRASMRPERRRRLRREFGPDFFAPWLRKAFNYYVVVNVDRHCSQFVFRYGLPSPLSFAVVIPCSNMLSVRPSAQRPSSSSSRRAAKKIA